MYRYLAIGAGSALGGVARYWLTGALAARIGQTFPLGTLVVNVLGCAFIGFFAALTAPDGRLLAGPSLRQFVMIGVCGGFTTFSTFGLETLNLAREGEWLKAGANALLSLVLCLIAVWAGHLAATQLNEIQGA